MKLAYSWVWASLLIGLVSFTTPGDKKEFTQSVKKEFAIDANGLVGLANKYGNINVLTWEKDRAKIEVTITVQAGNEEKALKVFDRINIDFSNNGSSQVRAETQIESQNNNWWGSSGGSGEFTIDYEVYIPSTVELELYNKYGNIDLAPVEGKTTINLKYGNTQVQGVDNDMVLNLGYGNATVLQAKDFAGNLAYCKLNLGKTRDLNIESKYSKINVEQANDLRVTSKYDTYEIGKLASYKGQGKYDNIVIEQIDDLSAISKYSDFQIENITNSLDLDLQYGEVNVEQLSRGFSEVRLVGRYTDYKMGVENGASYQLEATADYAGISYPSEMNITYEKDNGTFHEVEGHMGTENARSVIKVRLDYGGL
ncbi:MAG: hypothetical protein AAFU60_00135, partial [Bacteroidota bacterium]